MTWTCYERHTEKNDDDDDNDDNLRTNLADFLELESNLDDTSLAQASLQRIGVGDRGAGSTCPPKIRQKYFRAIIM